MCRVYSKFTKNVQKNQEHKSLSRKKINPFKKLGLVSITFCPAATTCIYTLSWFSVFEFLPNDARMFVLRVENLIKFDENYFAANLNL